jgi:hypothetical protein
LGLSPIYLPSCLISIESKTIAVTYQFAIYHFSSQDGCSTPHAGLNGYGIKWAVSSAGTAFHAGILIFNVGFFLADQPYFMRTDNRAHPAARAFILIQLEGNYITYIAILHFHILPFPFYQKSAMSRATRPRATEIFISGMAILVSLLTPENEV